MAEKPMTLLFNEMGLKIWEQPDPGQPFVVQAGDGPTLWISEGSARRAGLALRRAVRKRKEARGDCPRGRREAERRAGRESTGAAR